MFIIITIILCLLWPFDATAAHQWPALRGSSEGRGSLVYAGDTELREWHYTYKSGRRYETGLAVWASPALAIVAGHPMAFIGGYDQTLHALDLAEKTAIWRKITNAEIATAPTVGKVDGVDVVFWGSADRTVYAYVAFNGKRLWTKELIPPSTTLDKVHLSSPFLTEDALYISCFAYDKSLPRNQQRGWLFCLDTTTGDIRWKLDVTSGFLSSPVGFQLNGKLHIAVAARRGLLQCFDVSGQIPRQVWRFQMPHEVFGSPVVTTATSPALLFLGSKYGNLIAIDAQTGKEVWQKMAGNWIDNTACIGEIEGKKMVYVGSHDYRVYAFDAETGETVWKRAVGGEVYSAPCFFYLHDRAMVAVACLDNHLYVLDAKSGDIITSFFTGQPIWDKVSKGETLWGSPAVFEAGDNTVILHGSFNDIVYTLPLTKESSLTAMARSAKSLWWSLLAVLVIFGGVVLPIVITLPLKKDRRKIS
jgi:outer membrane protein assembly factor BamB